MKNGSKVPDHVNIKCHLLQHNIDEVIHALGCLVNAFHSMLYLIMKCIDMILSHVIRHDMLLQHMGLFICLRQNLLEFDLGFLPLPELIMKMLSSLRIVKMGMAPQLKSFWSECQGTQRSLEHHWEVEFELIVNLGSLSSGWTHTTVSQFHQWFNG